MKKLSMSMLAACAALAGAAMADVRPVSIPMHQPAAFKAATPGKQNCDDLFTFDQASTPQSVTFHDGVRVASCSSTTVARAKATRLNLVRRRAGTD